MFDSRLLAVLVATTVGLVVTQPRLANAGWWTSGPADFEECADIAEKAASKELKTAALAECNAKFAGRRKSGGGYSYYDFMQDRSFDIAGPNPTAEEQKYIDQQYTLFLAKERHNLTVASLTKSQEPEPVALSAEPERPTFAPSTFPQSMLSAEKTPLPPQRPSNAQIAANIARAKAVACKKEDDPAKASFSCHWPMLSARLSDLKKLLTPATLPAGKAKKS